MLVLAGPASGRPKLKADYRFEHSFNSSKGTLPELQPEGPVRACPPCAKFVNTEMNGSKQGAWSWPADDGLKLRNAVKALGRNGSTYTFVMLVNLDVVNNYRKLVDFSNLQDDTGWYAYYGSLYPYDLSDFDYSSQLIAPGKWSQIALTRGRHGIVRGYVNGHEIGTALDSNDDEALGAGGKLHFLIDDSSGGEDTGGLIARLRIWNAALSPGKIKALRR